MLKENHGRKGCESLGNVSVSCISAKDVKIAFWILKRMSRFERERGGGREEVRE